MHMQVRRELTLVSGICILAGMCGQAAANSCVGVAEQPQQASDPYANSYFLLAANIASEQNARVAEPKISSGDGQVGLLEGNGFLIDVHGTVGTLLTAKHVIEDICSKRVNNSDSNVYLISPAAPTVMVKADIPGNRARMCGGNGSDSGVGGDVGILTVDLSAFAGVDPTDFKPMPTSTAQGKFYRQYSIDGIQPDRNLQRWPPVNFRAIPPETDGGKRIAYEFEVAGPVVKGDSGGAVLGYSDDNKFAVIGVVTNLPSYWSVIDLGDPSGVVTNDELNTIFEQNRDNNAQNANSGIGMDLAVITPALADEGYPDIGNGALANQLLSVATQPGTAQNLASLDKILDRVSNSADEMAIAQAYLRTKKKVKYQEWFLPEVMAAELTWCWNAGVFMNDLRASVAAPPGNVQQQVALSDVGEHLLQVANGSAPTDPRKAAALRASVIALTAASARGADARSATSARDSAMGAVSLAALTNSSSDQAQASQALANAEQKGVSTPGFLITASNYRVQAAQLADSPTESATLLDQASKGYAQIIASPAVSAKARSAARSAKSYAAKLKAGLADDHSAHP